MAALQRRGLSFSLSLSLSLSIPLSFSLLLLSQWVASLLSHSLQSTNANACSSTYRRDQSMKSSCCAPCPLCPRVCRPLSEEAACAPCFSLLPSRCCCCPSPRSLFPLPALLLQPGHRFVVFLPLLPRGAVKPIDHQAYRHISPCYGRDHNPKPEHTLTNVVKRPRREIVQDHQSSYGNRQLVLH